jgi:serine protease Do
LIMVLVASLAQADVVLPDFAELTERHSATVVRIQAETSAKSQEIPRERVPDIYRYFFGDQPFEYETPPSNSQGSGFIVSEDGYILTNYHVVNGADDITVILTDQREMSARLVGTDSKTDIAVLKVDAKGLQAVKFGDSDALRVGEWVMAIGTPFGLDFSVTAGIVSAKGRALESENYVPFIQTDVAINPGNSGGPLFNTDGEVVGINSQIYTRDGGYMGLSFAIPSNLAVDVFEQLRDQGSVARGWLGVTMLPEYNTNPELAEALGLDRARGALIDKVAKDSPASKAGVRAQDIILSFNGSKVATYQDLAPLVGATRPGTKVKMEILRNRKVITLTVEVGQAAAAVEARPQKQAQRDDRHNDRLKLNVRDLTEEERGTLGEGGVFVTEVEDGAGKEAGLIENDIITMINGRFVDNVDEFQAVVENLPERELFALRIVRNGRSNFLTMRLQK